MATPNSRLPDYVIDSTKQENTSKFIVAQLRPETGMYGAVPRVLVSNHPRFRTGVRFDYGFLQLALADGYTVLFVGNEIQP